MDNKFMNLVGQAISIYAKLFDAYGGETCIGVRGLAKKLGVDYNTADEVRNHLLVNNIIRETVVKANVFEPKELSLGYDGNRPHSPEVPYYEKGRAWK